MLYLRFFFPPDGEDDDISLLLLQLCLFLPFFLLF